MEWNIVEASAPGRAGIIGNPSDMYGGSVVSCATRERARCRVEPADRLSLNVGGDEAAPDSALDLQPVGDHTDIARAALRALTIDPARDAFRLEATTDIPMSAGLAGSTALLCAIAMAVDAARGRHYHNHALVELIRAIERNELGVLCGFQDAAMTVFGDLRFMDVRGREELRQGPDEPYVVAESLSVHSFPFLCAHTGVQRHSGKVHKSLRERWEEGEPAVVEGYLRLQRLAALGKRALLDQDWPSLAALMTENHAIQRDLGGSGESNERLIQAALDGGALAAKLAGAGGGGTIIALTLEPEHTAAALQAAGANRLLTPDPTAPGITVASSL
jgi:galactokinase/mevalonate kinase-like predicted kinase